MVKPTFVIVKPTFVIVNVWKVLVLLAFYAPKTIKILKTKKTNIVKQTQQMCLNL